MTRKLDLTLFEDQIKAIEAFVLPGAVANFEQDSVLVPVSYVFAKRDSRGQPTEHVNVILADHYGMDKDEMRAMQQSLVDATDAVGIAFLSEAWLVRADASATFVDISLPPSDHPQRQEVLIVTLWHRDGIHVWEADIVRVGDKPPRLSDFTRRRMPVDGMHGRLTNYFRNQRATVEA